MPQEPSPTNKPSWWARIRGIIGGLGPAGPWLLVATGGPLLGLLVVTATSSTWLPWFGQGLDSILIFLVLGALLSGLCLVPSQVVSLVAGYLYGTWIGTLIGLLSVIFAAMIGYSLWSRVVGTRVLEAIGREPKAARVHRALLGKSNLRTAWLLALLRLSPVTPFAATNLLMASFGVRGSVFLTGTILGVAPRLVAVSLVGAELSEFDWDASAGSWPTILAIIATLVFLTVITRIARDALKRETDAVDDVAESSRDERSP